MNFLFALFLVAVAAPSADVRSDADVEVYSCNFEKQNDINFDGWPDHWTRRRGPGYPQYLKVAISPPSDQELQGNHVLQLELNGGAIQVNSPPIDFNAKYDYVFTGRVRTQGLQRNIAYASVTLYDAQRKMVFSLKSAPIQNSPDWQAFEIGPFTSDNEQAVQAVLSLHLRPTDKPDLTGLAQFDDLRLLKVPQLKMRTNNPFNIYLQGEPVSVTATVSNVQEKPVPVDFTLHDPQGKTLASGRQTDLETFTWEPPVTDAGYYRVHVVLHVSDDLKIERDVHLAVIEKTKTQIRGEFGWTLPRDSHSLPLKSLPELMHRAAVNWIKLPLWKEADDPQRILQVSWLAEHLRLADVQMIGVLDEPPEEYRKQFRNPDTLPIGEIFADPSVWPDALDAVLSRLSLHVHWWQLGRDNDSTFLALPDTEQHFRAAQKHVRDYGTNMRLGLAWPWVHEVPAQLTAPWDFVSRSAEPALTDQELSAYLGDGKTQPGPRRWVMIEPLPRSEYDDTVRAHDLVSRMLAAKIGKADGIFIANPFDAERGLMSSAGWPTELFLPWRTTALMITGAKHLGSVHLPQGSRNEIFVRGDEFVMVVWNNKPTAEQLYLGDNVKVTDVWGHATTPRERLLDDRREQIIDVGPVPVFVSGMDPFATRWRLNYRLLTPRLEIAPGRPQPIQVQVTNSAELGAEGTLRLTVPDSWRVSGREMRLSLGPNRQESPEVLVQLGSDATTGPYPVRFDFDLTTNRSHRFSVYDTMHVGLGDVDLQMLTRLDDNGNLLVEQLLINNTETPVSFWCELFIPNRGREHKAVRNLGQGQATNLFVIPNGEELIGKTLFLRANEINGDRKLSLESRAER